MKLQNWMGSRILTQAVEKGIVSKMEAEVVIESAVYDRSFSFIAKELGIKLVDAIELYQQAILKLRRWIDTSVIVFPRGRIVVD